MILISFKIVQIFKCLFYLFPQIQVLNDFCFSGTKSRPLDLRAVTVGIRAIGYKLLKSESRCDRSVFRETSCRGMSRLLYIVFVNRIEIEIEIGLFLLSNHLGYPSFQFDD